MDGMAKRLPQWAQQWIQAAMPEESLASFEKAKAYKDMELWLKRNRSLLWPLGGVAPCVVHNRDCPCHPAPSFQNSDKLAITDVSPTTEVGPSSSRLNRKRKRGGHESESAEPIYISSGGLTCVGWTPEGSRDQFAHPSEVDHALWLNERRVRAEQKLEHVFQ